MHVDTSRNELIKQKQSSESVTSNDETVNIPVSNDSNSELSLIIMSFVKNKGVNVVGGVNLLALSAASER